MKIKQRIILSLTSLILFSCQLSEIQGDWNSFKFNKIKFNNIEEVQSWVHYNIDYVDDNVKYSRDYFKYPSETLDDDEGDCEDMAILIIAIVHYQFRYKCNLVIVKDDNFTHAVIRYKGCYYNSTDFGKYHRKVKYAYEYEYDEIPYLISTKR